jgi:hypothetical protein
VSITALIDDDKEVRAVEIDWWHIAPVASITLVKLADLLRVRFGA